MFAKLQRMRWAPLVLLVGACAPSVTQPREAPTFEIDGVNASLRVFAYASEPSAGEGMLIPFRDATSGAQTYAGGRYLEIEGPDGAGLVLDFNRATNPLCAYSEHYNCPLPPRFNLLSVTINAGAKAPSTRAH